ncbi:MAG: SPOR domain-containing protein [Alphaproteobacteria bacterium]
MKRHCFPILATLLYATSAQAGFNEARQAFIEGRYDIAYRELVPLADAGDPRSQIGMGLLHAKGLGVPQDNVAAYVWFDKVLDRDEPLHPVIRTLAETNRSYLARHMSTAELETALKRIQETPEPKMASAEPAVAETHQAMRPVMLASAEPSHAIEVVALDPATTEPAAGNAAMTLPPYNLQAALFEEPAKAPASRPAMAGSVEGVRIQIGAYRNSDEGTVNAAWQRIRAKQPGTFASLKPLITQVSLGERGEFHRLQLGPFADVGSAKAMCDKLRASQQDCFVVPAGG